jgi:mannose-6-phosphate isomerase-like protein (cupin superfamily)
VTRHDQGHRLTTANYDYAYLCATMTGRRMVPSVARVLARSLAEFGPLLRHAGEEFLFVLSGCVAVHLEAGPTLVLEPGDVIYFDASQGHAFLSVGEAVAEILVVLSGDDKQHPPV